MYVISIGGGSDVRIVLEARLEQAQLLKKVGLGILSQQRRSTVANTKLGGGRDQRSRSRLQLRLQ